MNLWRRATKLIGSGLFWLGAAIVGGPAPKAKAVDDDSQYTGKAGSGPADGDWSELVRDLGDAFQAWKRNFLIRQVVRLTTAYVVGDGIRIISKNKDVDAFAKAFWTHDENKMEERLPALCDELTRAGELYPILFTNKISGTSQIRFVPACQIQYIDTDSDDYEKELTYSEIIPGQLEPKSWKSKRTARVFAQRKDNRHRRPEPVMLHYTINKPVGATRGEGDLTPILPWAKRYTEWLKDRVRFNRLRTELAAVDVEIEDDSRVSERRKYYQANPPGGGGVNVHGRGEKVTFPAANIQGFDAEPDGRALRLAFAAGADIPLHFLAEGSSATRSTATEMGDPTHRHYRMRQKDFVNILKDIITQAWRRYELVTGREYLEDLQLVVEAPDVSRADNKAMADAAKTIVEAFSVMKANGWISDELAVQLSFKFAGELLEKEQIDKILKEGKQNASNINQNGNGQTHSIYPVAGAQTSKSRV